MAGGGDRSKVIDDAVYQFEALGALDRRVSNPKLWTDAEREAASMVIKEAKTQTVESAALATQNSYSSIEQVIRNDKLNKRRRLSCEKGGAVNESPNVSFTKKLKGLRQVRTSFQDSEKENVVPWQGVQVCSTARSERPTRECKKVPDYLVSINKSYSAQELIPLLFEKSKDKPRTLKCATIKELVKSKKVPVNVTNIYRRLSLFKKGDHTKALKAWHDGGREQIATDDELLELLERKYFNVSAGNTVPPASFKQDLTEMRKRKRAARGRADDGKQVTDKTAKVAWLRCLTFPGVKEVIPQPKTYSRFVSEHSLRTALTYCITALVALFLPCLEYPQNYTIDKVDELVADDSDGSFKGTWVDPALHFSTDDTTIVLGVDKNNRSQFCLANAHHDGSTRSFFTTDNNAKTFNQVMRVCLTMPFWIFSKSPMLLF